MMPVNARLRLRGSQGQWNLKLPVYGKCDSEPLKALSVVQVDEPVGPEVLEALARIPNLLQARLVRLG